MRGRKHQTEEGRRVEVMRRAQSMQSRFSISGHEKEGEYAPKPVTLPKLKFLERANDERD